MADTATALGTRYSIDSRSSRLIFRAFASGFLSVMGHDPVISAREVTGEIHFVPDQPDASVVRLKVPAKSLTSQNEMSDKDRREMERTMHEEVLESARYPEIVYEGRASRLSKAAEGRYQVDIDGQLALHGVARAERASAQVFLTGDSLRAQGTIAVRQTDYVIKLVSVAGGTLKIKDDVTCEFDVVARKLS
jgi:polyisoprenoid-binding protein YceI